MTRNETMKRRAEMNRTIERQRGGARGKLRRRTSTRPAAPRPARRSRGPRAAEAVRRELMKMKLKQQMAEFQDLRASSARSKEARSDALR